MSGVPTATESRPAASVRVRRMRAARGACWVIVAGLGAAATLAVLDAAVRLPAWVRGLGLAVWVTAVGVLAWRLVLVPWKDGDDARNPLRQAKRDLHGNLRAAAAAALALAGCLLLAAFLPGAADHLRRVALPWHRPATGPYRLVVTSGEPVVARGGSVTLSAFAEVLDVKAAPPTAAVFAFRDRPGSIEARTPVTPDANAAFHLTRTAVADFEYRVEAGGIASDWFTVTVLDPAEVAPSVVMIEPPHYAKFRGGAADFEGFGPFTALQHATTHFALRFTRPAAAAFLDLRPDDGKPTEHVQIALADDRLSGTATLKLRHGGTLRVVTVVDERGKRLRHETAVRVTVVPDAPPRFEHVSGIGPRPLRVPPNARLAVRFTAADDIWLGGAVLEYIPAGESKPVAVPIHLRAGAGRMDLDLEGKGWTGDTLRVRIRVWDTRTLNDPVLKPQEATYPETGWAAVVLDPAAPPLDQQEIAARRDATGDALRTALADTRTLAADAETLAGITNGKTALDPDHVVRLNNLRDGVRKVVAALHAAARDTALVPELRPLAAAIRGTADDALKAAADALGPAARDDPADRAAALAAADAALKAAADELDGLAARNDRLARDRLDRVLVAALLADQRALAAADAGPPELAKRQRELLARLRQLLADSDALRAAADAARVKDVHRLAGSASDLAGMILELDTAARQLRADIRGGLLGSITADHVRLATLAADRLARATAAARLANVALPKPAEFAKVTDLIAAGKTVEPLTELERLAGRLDAVAVAFEAHVAARTDPKAAAHQLAQWQDDLRARFRAATANAATNFHTLPDATKAAFRTEQAAIRAAADALALPPGSLRTTHETAADHLARTAEFLAASGANADVGMKAAADQLNRLVDLCPTAAERLAKARGEFEKLRPEQEAILAAAEQHVRGEEPGGGPALARKLGPLLERQQRQQAAFAALDLPGLDARRARVAAALAAAAADLKAGLPLDVAASQAWAKREFDRLRIALTDSAPPPDTLAEAIARRQAAVADEVESLGPNVTARQLEPAAAAHQELVKLAGQLPPLPEAAALRHAAVEAVETAFRRAKDDKPEDLVRRLRGAADAMTKLAERLTGGESDVARVRRLAANRKAAAEAKKAGPSNGEAGRQLGREADELLHTRVGAGGQLLKKRALELYAKLKDDPAPDRKPGAQKQLADALDELAAKMADVPELATPLDRTPPPPFAPEAEAYWPSKGLADPLRELAVRLRTLRDRVSKVGPAVSKQTKPGEANPLAAMEKRQRELATAAGAQAAKLAGTPPAAAADSAATLATTAADRLRVGSVRAARESAEQAATEFRGAGGSELAARQDAIILALDGVPDPAAASAAQQKARGKELADRLAELVRVYEHTGRDYGPDEPAGRAFAEAATTATAAGKLLAEATDAAEKGQTDAAEKLWNEAQAQLQVAAARAAAAAPESTVLPEFDSAILTAGAALTEAETAMRRAVAELGAKVDVAAARTAMRAAATALERAGSGVAR